MNIAWLKYEKDKTSFRIPENFGMPIIKLKDPEEIDNSIKNLAQKEYDTIVISNEIASFSEDIIKKYDKNENIRIIIAPGK